MKTQTDLVCLNHFGLYYHEQIDKRNKLPIDISPLNHPIGGLCCIDSDSNGKQPDYGNYFSHNKIILAVTWEN
jgi:hypothetical protein